jgi:EmrB/QacA subfamily drug resistance transporter
MHPQGPPDCARHTLAEAKRADPTNRRRDGSLKHFVVVRPGQPQPETAAEQAYQNKWAVLVLVAVGTFMTTLDASIVNISLPSIARAFHTPFGSAVEWVIIAYLVVIAATLLTFGRLSDIYGRKPIWLTGLVVFTLGSVLCGTASSLSLLIAARAFQGLGGALLFAPGLAILADTFPSSERGFAFGLNAVVVSLGASAGPTLGGLITEHLSWRWIFYLNVPFGVLGLIGTLRVLRDPGRRERQHLDLAGAVLFAVGFATLTLGLSFGQEWGWISERVLSCLGIGFAALVAAVLVERRVSTPLISLAQLRNRIFASALLSMVAAMLALFAISFMLPFYCEQLRGFSAAQSGVLLTPLSLTIAVVAPWSGALADRLGSRWLASAGLAITCVGLLLLAHLDMQTSTWGIVWRLAVTGLGQGIFQTPNTRALMNAAPAGEQGESSGLFATGRVVGQSLSVAIAGTIFASSGGAIAGQMLVNAASGVSLSAAEISTWQYLFLRSFRAALSVCAVFAALGIVTALVRGSEGPTAREAERGLAMHE